MSWRIARLDAIAAQITAMETDTLSHDAKRRRYVQDAEAHLIALRRALTASDANAAAWHGFQLSRALDRADVTRFEPPAKRGQASMLDWRGE
jgi:hypothetical protein